MRLLLGIPEDWQPSFARRNRRYPHIIFHSDVENPLFEGFFGMIFECLNCGAKDGRGINMDEVSPEDFAFIMKTAGRQWRARFIEAHKNCVKEGGKR